MRNGFSIFVHVFTSFDSIKNHKNSLFYLHCAYSYYFLILKNGRATTGKVAIKYVKRESLFSKIYNTYVYNLFLDFSTGKKSVQKERNQKKKYTYIPLRTTVCKIFWGILKMQLIFKIFAADLHSYIWWDVDRSSYSEKKI